MIGARPTWNGASLALLSEVGGGGGVNSTSVAFTDGDLVKRVSIASGSVTAVSKIMLTVRRPDLADDSVDAGYLYIAQVVRVYAGGFDLVIVCFGVGLDDETENPPNETIFINWMAG